MIVLIVKAVKMQAACVGDVAFLVKIARTIHLTITMTKSAKKEVFCLIWMVPIDPLFKALLDISVPCNGNKSCYLQYV